jgi:hypothetical protein
MVFVCTLRHGRTFGGAGMTEIFDDIETLKFALIALEDGAGDERRAARSALRKMLRDKIAVVEQFESDLDEIFDNVPV